MQEHKSRVKDRFTTHRLPVTIYLLIIGLFAMGGFFSLPATPAFAWGDTYELTVDVSRVDAGEVKLNGQTLGLYPSRTVFENITTVELEAIPFDGWWFDQWVV